VFWLVAAELVHTQDKIIKSFPEVASVWGHGNRLSSSRMRGTIRSLGCMRWKAPDTR